MSIKKEPKIREKRWSPELEEELLKFWDKEGLYRFDPGKPGEIYTIDTPPPYISGKWHVGSAAHYAGIDMVARYKRLLGYNVHFPIGWDRNGLPVEVIVERQFNIRVKDVDREYFINLCKQALDRVEAEVINQARRLGLSCDFENMYRTDSPEYRSLTQETFIELWRRGLIYEAERPTNWCPRCGTAIADAEVEYVETTSRLFYILFKVKETGENVQIATTRPELLAGCDAVIFNPTDPRYARLEGRKLIVPIYGKEVRVFVNSYAKPDFGTGLVMICSYGDTSDIRLFRELDLRPTRVIDENATLTEEAGFLKGLSVEEARRRIVEELSNRGLLVKAEEILQRVPVCWRCRTRLEFVEMSELYLKQEEFIDKVREASSRMVFHPESMRQILIDWINSVKGDWPISRRRYYATEVPLWYCSKCGEPYAPKPGKYYRPWRDSPGENAKCGKCGGTDFKGDGRVLDTWMDSSISQLFVTGYRRDEDLFKRSWICSLRPQGYEIIRTWLYYSILRTIQILGTPPFKEVRISGLGLDEKGEAMHKSKGNLVFPDEYLEKYGADAFRFWAASEAKLGSNYRFSEERLKGARLFLTKLWNIGRFISSFEYLDSKPRELCFLDRLALSELKRVFEEAKKDYDSLDFYGPSNLLRNYVWNFFADHYLEAVKPRAYLQGTREEAESAWYTLHRVLRACLIGLSPIIPFITDYLFRNIYGEPVICQSFPVLEDVEPVESEVATLFMNVNSAIWKFKKKLGVSLNEEIGYRVYVSERLKPLEQDLARMHGVKLSFKSPGEGFEEVDGVFFEKL
ncbi:MAG: valine--tRNA ligase [Candidatus Brockarchaeota archaeon]|nr:valine--tRNA ligase [Candidatus Brockarchaeota archaeon]MBO3809520.1 valine--tRNA ligase [Candidatus Brockarchaeota archaeon]